MENKMSETRKIFSPFENQLLLELIKTKIDIIECKETNKISSIRKNEAFAELAKEFNSTIGVTQRSDKQLRQRYLNLKKAATKGSARIRKELMKTGGGDECAQKIDGLEEQVLALGAITRPLQTTFDSDSSYLDNMSSVEIPEMSQGFSEIVPNSPKLLQEIESSDNFGVDADEINDLDPPISTQDSHNHVINKTPSVASTSSTTRQIKLSGGRRALQLFRNRAKPKSAAISSSAKAAEAFIQESKSRLEYERRKEEREEIEHSTKLQLLEKQIEREQKQIEREQKEIELEQKKIDVQEKILHILDTNPESLILSFK